MAIVEHPLRFLILALFLLIGLLIFFKVSDFLRNLSEKNKKKKESKPVEKKEEKSTEVKKSEEPVKQSVEKIAPEHINTTSNGYNYLHDRFVENPTVDDIVCQSEHSSVFLTDDEYNKIRTEKIEIKVKEDGSLNGKIDAMIKGNNSEKERLLSEFNNLSKEMKLLIIENILKNS